MKCMKEVIFMVDAQTEVMIKFFFTRGQQPPIMTIGKMYMGIKDGVPSI